ncbi:MAG: RNA polymerase factor sigma-54 [Rhodospirillales bacterium]
MALAPRLELRQSQSLVMTPQLQQAIKLLQLSNIELVEYVERELEQNPLLEREDDAVDGMEPPAELSSLENNAENGPENGQESDIGAADGLEADIDFVAAATSGAESESLDAPDDAIWDGAGPGDGGNFSEATAFSQSQSAGGGFDGDLPGLEETLSDSISLQDHLRSQLTMIDDAVDRIIAVHLIDLVDDSGYLPADLSPVADLLGCSEERVGQTLEKLQQFDPPGIFARNLAECLGLQLRDLDRLDPAMQALLDNLDLLAKRDLNALMKVCGVDAEDINDMVAEIKALNPKPALAFEQTVTQSVTPDVLMRQKAGGGWIVELNSETLPRVLVNNSYFAQISRATRSKDDKRYIVDCLASANWLVKSLHQRATTILKVATEIVRQQESFFLNGVQSLRPLVLRDIADVIEMHESTVSRVTSNKFMATPRGIYELKYFFTPALGNAFGGSSHSAESVRHRIKSLINGEPAEKILSDDKIVEILQKEGVDIARRTVAKYREAMGIGSSVQRRRHKRAAL